MSVKITQRKERKKKNSKGNEDQRKENSKGRKLKETGTQRKEKI